MKFTQEGQFRQSRYWTLPVPAERPDPHLTEETVAATVRDLFDESVRLRMIADVPLGAFLAAVSIQAPLLLPWRRSHLLR